MQSQSSTQPPALLPDCAKILVAEDPFVSSFLRTILQRHGHAVVVGDAARVSDLLRRDSVAPAVVITNRPEAFVEFAGSIHLLYIAATPDFHLASQFSTCRVLSKPFRNDELLEAVDGLAHSVVP
jgi:hypothetical protein